MKTVLFLMMISGTVLGATQSPPLFQADIPFGIDPNLYDANAPLIEFVATEPNMSVVSLVHGHNKGGWSTTLSIVMADGSPTSTVIQKLTERPVKDPNSGWNQGFQWAWTPPGEGIWYLELRLSTTGRPSWKTDRRTVAIYAFSDDSPWLWAQDLPTLRLAEAQRLWQYGKKVQSPLTSPTRVWR